MTASEKLKRCYESIRQKTAFVPKVALVLGSGLGDLADRVQAEASVSYRELEGFPVSTVEGHQGRFVFAYLAGVPVVMMQGRVHYYEGYSMEDVVLPIRLMGLLGAKALLLTNAAGGVNPSFHAGDFMMIQDQISSFVPSPLIGANLSELGPRFPDMSGIYDPVLQALLRREAEGLEIDLKEGVYLQFTGPNYESPAEIRMASLLGADAVGMSTACEAVAANHMGLRVCGISFISNPAAGITGEALCHAEVQKAADLAAPRFRALVTAAVAAIGKELPEKRG